jgi:cation diffusion facilitator CzcD-associated flavoprotein CzcO
MDAPFTVVVVGAGFSGICAAVRLAEAFPSSVSIVVYEKQEGIGGTWRDAAHYPGAACDVPSHLYSLSFAPNPYWTHHYSKQPEIQRYLNKVAEEKGVVPLIRFGHMVVECVWKESLGKWEVVTVASKTQGGSGERQSVFAEFVIAGNAPLCEPSFPNVPGRDLFRGTQFHSARWDFNFSADGKRIAVIGTGASAAQFVPVLAKSAASLAVFQRTPAWVAPRWDFRYPGVLRFLFSWVPGLTWLYRTLLYFFHESRYYNIIQAPKLVRWLTHTIVGWHLTRQVKDLGKRKSLKPDYDLGCKRIVLSDEFYPALAQENVAVVAGGVKSITATGVVGADGVEREVDAIVYATGFDIEASVKVTRFVGRPLENGQPADLKQMWEAVGGPEAYLGVTVPRFPNLFFTMGPNTGLGHNSVVTMIEIQVAYAIAAMQEARRRGWKSVEVKKSANEEYNKEIQQKLLKTVWSGCNSWYNLQGTKNISMWPGTVTSYWWALRRVDWGNYVCA